MRVVLTGASGQLGAYLGARLAAIGHEVFPWSGSDGNPGMTPVDLTCPGAIDAALGKALPEVIVHAAAISSIEGVRRDPERGREVNVNATKQLASWCARRDARLLFTSTDLVFDGSTPWFRENDPVRPLVAYGQTKAEAESAVLAIPRGLVARLSLLFGFSRSTRPTPLEGTIEALKRGQSQAWFVDEFRTPLDLATAADVLVRLLEADVAGIVHVGGTERMSRFDLVRRAAVALGIDEALVLGSRQRDASFPEPRPVDVSLDTTRLASILPEVRRPTVEEALRDRA